jgi:hypothetical protein
MKKQPKQDQAVDYVDRDHAISESLDSFAANLTTNAAKARTDLVDVVFQSCEKPQAFEWRTHAQLAIALGDIRSRDGLLRKLHDNPEARSSFQAHLTTEIERAQEAYVAPFATVIAGIAWLDGDGEFAAVMVDRALNADSAYSLAQLLDIALRHDVPSFIWSQSLEAVSYESCIAGAA